ncbi:MAG: DUF3106 domain-containing protein [Acidobacteriota bacterium]|nr:DUF3106 domain-containing protein [Acidobacteriota bacterium]
MIPIGILAISLFGYVTMSLWNWLMPMLFGLPTVTFWQALGLLILSKLLFGGFHGRGGGGSRWKRDMAERWEKMSPEERERMRAGMRGRWGCGWGNEREPAAEQKPAV